YPAKMFLLASLLFSMLAGRQWSRIRDLPHRGWLWISAAVAVTSLLLLVGVAVIPLTSLTIPIPRGGSLFGPFDAAGCWRDILFSLSQTMLISAAIFFAIRWHWQKTISGLPIAALLLTVVDICLANGWMVQLAPQDLWTKKNVLAEIVVANARPSLAPVRIHKSSDWYPPEWSDTGSVTRQAEGVFHDSQTLVPKYNLTRGAQRKISLIAVGGSTSNHVLGQLALRSKYDGLRTKHDATKIDLSRDYLEMLGAQFYLSEGDADFDALEKVDTSAAPVDDVSLWKIPAPARSAWIVHQVSFIDSPDRRHSKALTDFSRAVMFPSDKLFDWRNIALVEGFPGREEIHSMPPEDAVEQCKLVRWSETELVYEVDLAAPGYIVQNDVHTKDWRAYTQSDKGQIELPVHVTNLLVRGVFLPKGKHTVTFRLVPKAFYFGSAISILAWCFGLAMLCFAGRLDGSDTRVASCASGRSSPRRS
ncbi:MAG: hypothetical protein ACI9HK_005027, partial [Pirellulaceae bacterium]